MSIALSEFWTRLVRGGLTDTEGCKTIAAAFARAHGDSPPEDAVSLAKFLIKTGRLNQYQARALLASPPRELRIGPFLKLGDQSPPPLAGWVPVQRTSDAAQGWLRQIAASQMAPGDAEAIELHATVSAPSLQPIEWQAGAAGGGLVFSPLRSGRILSEMLAETAAVDPSRVAEIAVVVAEALKVLHEAGLAHGQVRADRLWVPSRGDPVLLRDPTLATSSSQAAAGLLENLESAHSDTAPELVTDSRSPDASTDLYSLGCLLFRLRFGRHPFEGRPVDEIAAAHRTEVPAELAAAVRQGAAGDPLLRVIAFAMAKNRSARFSDASRLADALRQTQQLLAAGAEKDDASSSPTPRASVSGHPVAPQRAAASRRSGPVRRRKKKSRAPLVLGALCIPVLMLLIVLIVDNPDRPSEPEPPPVRPQVPETVPSVAGSSTVDEDSSGNAPATTATRVAEASAGGYELVQDEQLLWAPPYPAGQPASIRLLPPGPGLILSTRLSQWRNTATGEAFTRSLSPELTELLESAAQRGKVPLDTIQRLSVALHPGDGGWPEVSLAVELDEAVPLAELLERWQAAESRTPQGETIYAGDQVDGDAYYVAPAESSDGEGGTADGQRSGESLVSQFAVGPVERIGDVAAAGGGSIPLPASLQRLWDRSSDQADVVVLATPNFVFADARQLLASMAPELMPPLRSLLVPDAGGVLLTATADQSRLYAEARLVSSGIIQDTALLRSLRETIHDWPEWANEFLIESVPDSSWRLLANRLPLMLQFVVDHTRLGISDGQVVANAYLPGSAASQVALATLLAWNTPADAATTTTAASPAEPLSIDEMLSREMSISFGQESLEFAINSVVDQFRGGLPEGSEMLPVRLLGGDLEKMGITQNQQIRDFSKSDLPLRKVLTDLLVAANPDRTASGPSDPKQTLVWVVTEDPESPGQQAILITTRSAAEGTYELPKEFRTDA